MKGEFYSDHRDATKNYSNRCRKFCDGFIAVKIGKGLTKQGFLPMGRIILDKSRIRLHKINAVLGDLVQAIRTDAFFVNPVDAKEATHKLMQAGMLTKDTRVGYDKIGHLKFGMKSNKKFGQPLVKTKYANYGSKIIPMVKSEHCVNQPVQKIMTINEAKTMDDLDTNRWSEVDELMKKGPLHIGAKCPGAGKTYLVEEWVKRTGQKDTALFVCPWNPLCADLRKRGFNAITLHALCGKVPTKENETEVFKKPHDITGITHIHFDEICLYSPSHFEWIQEFLLKQTTGFDKNKTGHPQ
jgi:hypothetical protein